MDALAHKFNSAVHLRCFRHLQQNVERHLHDECFPQSAIKVYIQNMFGFTDKVGLVDSFDAAEFDVDVSELKDKWNQREEDCLLSCSRTPQL